MAPAEPQPIRIAGRPIGPGHGPYLVAEMSANHLGSLERACEIVRAAADSGVDAIKLQTYTADSLTIDSDAPDFCIEAGPWAGHTLHQLYRQAHTPWEWHGELFALADELGVHCFSSPFDARSVARLEDLNAPAYKIASFEIVDHELIARAAKTDKPVVLSTGTASDEEVCEAVTVARHNGVGGVIVLHCVSGYPAQPSAFDLHRMEHLRRITGCVVGLSDHSRGCVVPISAVALGAVFVEKHLTLRRSDGGPDAGFSLQPEEMKEMVSACRAAAAAVRQRTGRSSCENQNRRFRRSLYAVADIGAGEQFTRANTRSIRPGFGLLPKHLPAVLGRRAVQSISRGTPLSWGLVEREGEFSG